MDILITDSAEQNIVLFESAAISIHGAVFIRLTKHGYRENVWCVSSSTEYGNPVGIREDYYTIEEAEHAFMRHVEELDGDKFHLHELCKRVYPMRLQAEREFYAGCCEIIEHAWRTWNYCAYGSGYVHQDIKLIPQGYADSTLTRDILPGLKARASSIPIKG